jgi:hypothetical protein
VCPGYSNHTHGNNMINRCNVIKITSNSLFVVLLVFKDIPFKTDGN